jgi:hypothetical protein
MKIMPGDDDAGGDEAMRFLFNLIRPPDPLPTKEDGESPRTNQS